MMAVEAASVDDLESEESLEILDEDEAVDILVRKQVINDDLILILVKTMMDTRGSHSMMSPL